jgi:iron complex outermembrane recepter protein
MMSPWFAALLLGIGAQDPEPEIDIEDLMNVQVTSPSRKEQSLADVPAAIHVILGDDLKRTGVTSLPEALRRVPGMQVARSRSSAWAVSARGFSDSSSNKLLVLMDGRSVYSPLHAGVFWDVQDTFLEDVDRIEAIRGPGGSLWGSNAINGVVNIITKRAEETQGAVVTGGGGTEERVFGGVRYGFKIDDDHYARAYAKYFARDDAASGVDPDEDAHDGWFMGRAGFRSDWKSGDRDRMTVIADGYGGQIKERVNNPSLTSPTGVESFNDRIRLDGGNVLFRWVHDIGPLSDWTLQVYYDRTRRDASLFEDALDTVDLDFQHRFHWADIHDVNWGLGYRIHRSHFNGDFVIQIDPERRTDDLLSAFVQDEIALAADQLRLILGSKFEHNDYSGFEVQPSVRLAWKPAADQTLWAAVSRSVRTPSIIDADIRINAFIIPGPTPTVTSIEGDRNFKSEELIAYEAGYRIRPVEFMTADVAAFYSRYDRLRSIGAPGTPFLEADPPPQHLVIPITLENELDGHCWGAEGAVNLQAAPGVLVQAHYAYLRMHLSDDAAEGRDPQHSAWLRARVDLGADWNLDAVGRYVSRLKAFDVDGYIECDLRVAWKDPERRLEIALVGQNLMRESHAEFQSEASRSEIERGGYLSILWGF